MSRNKTQAQRNAATEPVAPVSVIVESTPAVASGKPASIRQLIMSGLLAQRARKDIAADLVTYFPTSQAAAKAQKHIAWYAGTMRKAGQLPKVGATAQAAAAQVATAQAAAAQVAAEQVTPEQELVGAE